MSEILMGPGSKPCVCAKCEHCGGARHGVDDEGLRLGIGLWCSGCIKARGGK